MDSVTQRGPRMFIVIAIAVMLVSASTLAFGQGVTTTRPIADFLVRQGTFCLNPSPSCHLFRPPVPNYGGWSGREPGEPNSVYDRFSLVDYAGVANAWLVANGHASLGTQVTGTITERRLTNGTAEVRVNLFTTKALAFVETCVPSPTAGPCPGEPPGIPLFGYTATDVLAGAPAALADSFLQFVFINPSPGAPLPDLVQLTNTAAFANIRLLSFRSNATGPLRSGFGVPNGTPGRSGIIQTGLLMLPRYQGAVSDAFPAEVMSLRVVGQ